MKTMLRWLVTAFLWTLVACHKPAAVVEEEWVDDQDAFADALVFADVGMANDVTGADDTLATDTGKPSPPPNVLFIGNSYTYVNDLPAMTAQFAQSAGVKVQQASVTQGGATLAVMLAQTEAVTKIAEGGWTHVVLQGQSVEPAGDLTNFLAAAKTLANDVHKVKAQVAFYQTWPRKAGDALYQQAWTGGTQAALAKLLHDGYEKAAVQNGGVRVPVGDAWMLTLAKHPEIELYQGDGSHPVPAGTYLAACVFSVTLFGVNPAKVVWAPDGMSMQVASALRQMCRTATEAP